MALGVLILAPGCEEDKTKPPVAPKSRAAAVEATEPVVPKPSAVPQPSTEPASAKPRRKLCEGQMTGAGEDLPTAEISRAGEPEPDEEIPVGDGKWTWINFWAAWCVPCREEIPRLRRWESKLSKTETPMRLVFVSLDDDQRQLTGFLAKQPLDGIKSTYWLKDGTEREEWMAEAKMETEPELPAHILVDPKGKARCKIEGAVEDGDYDRVVELLSL